MGGAHSRRRRLTPKVECRRAVDGVRGCACIVVGAGGACEWAGWAAPWAAGCCAPSGIGMRASVETEPRTSAERPAHGKAECVVWATKAGRRGCHVSSMVTGRQYEPPTSGKKPMPVSGIANIVNSVATLNRPAAAPTCTAACMPGSRLHAAAHATKCPFGHCTLHGLCCLLYVVCCRPACTRAQAHMCACLSATTAACMHARTHARGFAVRVIACRASRARRRRPL